jgi:hypothetical protein
LKPLAWVLIVAAFIITIIVLVLQLDLNSKHRNKKSVSYKTQETGYALILKNDTTLNLIYWSLL